MIAPVCVFSCGADAFEFFAESPSPPAFVLVNVFFGNWLWVANCVGKVVHSGQLEKIQTYEGGLFHALSRRGHSMAEKKADLLVAHNPHKILGQSIIHNRNTAGIERNPLQKQPHAGGIVRSEDWQERFPASG